MLIFLLACGTESTDTAAEAPSTSNYAGSHDDLPIADDDIQALQQLLNDKWTFFLYEMDKYNIVRDSTTNDDMAAKMSYTFADEYEFSAYWSDGSEFGDTQGTYTPLSWLEAQDVDTWNFLHDNSTMLVPSYSHILKVEVPGERVILEGYHEHAFIGEDMRLIYGDARHLAYEYITYEKIDGIWRVTDYVETVHDATELAP